MSEALNDIKNKDLLVKNLKEEIIDLERKLRDNLLLKLQFDTLKNST